MKVITGQIIVVEQVQKTWNITAVKD